MNGGASEIQPELFLAYLIVFKGANIGCVSSAAGGTVLQSRGA